MEKAVRDGLQVPTLPSVHSLPQDFIDEALILSDILELNEISSVELLLAGEQQLPRYVMRLMSIRPLQLSNMFLGLTPPLDMGSIGRPVDKNDITSWR